MDHKEFCEGLKFVNDNHEKKKRQEYKIEKEKKERAYRKAQELKEKKARSKRVKKAIALLLAGGLGISAIGLTAHSIHQNNEHKEKAIVEMQETGTGMANSGLSKETIQQLEEYDELYAKGEKQEITEEELLAKISGMESLATNVLKERMANITGAKKEDISYNAHIDRGEFNASITVGKDYEKTRYAIKTLGNRGPYIPSEFREVLSTLAGQYELLSSRVEKGELSKRDALESLMDMYPNIKDLAEANLIVAKDGDIASVDLEQTSVKDEGFEIDE